MNASNSPFPVVQDIPENQRERRIFLYHCTYSKEGLFGKVKKVRQSPYGYIPLSEVQEWRREIEKRAVERNEVTAEELDCEWADWVSSGR